MPDTPTETTTDEKHNNSVGNVLSDNDSNDKGDIEENRPLLDNNLSSVISSSSSPSSAAADRGVHKRKTATTTATTPPSKNKSNNTPSTEPPPPPPPRRRRFGAFVKSRAHIDMKYNHGPINTWNKRLMVATLLVFMIWMLHLSGHLDDSSSNDKESSSSSSSSSDIQQHQQQKHNQQQLKLFQHGMPTTIDKSLPRIVVLGERHTGLDWFEKAVKSCVNPKHVQVSSTLTRPGHWFQDELPLTQLDDPFQPDTIVVPIFLNPYDWVEWMRLLPDYAPNHMTDPTTQESPMSWSTFVHTQWSIPRPPQDKALRDTVGPNCQFGFAYKQVVSCVPPSENIAQYDTEANPVYELDPVTHKPFKSIVQLRAAKIFNWVREIKEWEWIKDVIPVQYEQVRIGSKLQRIIDDICKPHGWSCTCPSSIINGEPAMSMSMPEEMTIEFLQWMNDHVDWKAEEEIGYDPWNEVPQVVLKQQYEISDDESDDESDSSNKYNDDTDQSQSNILYTNYRHNYESGSTGGLYDIGAQVGSADNSDGSNDANVGSYYNEDENEDENDNNDGKYNYFQDDIQDEDDGDYNDLLDQDYVSSDDNSNDNDDNSASEQYYQSDSSSLYGNTQQNSFSMTNNDDSQDGNSQRVSYYYNDNNVPRSDNYNNYQENYNSGSNRDQLSSSLLFHGTTSSNPVHTNSWGNDYDNYNNIIPQANNGMDAMDEDDFDDISSYDDDDGDSDSDHVDYNNNSKNIGDYNYNDEMDNDNDDNGDYVQDDDDNGDFVQDDDNNNNFDDDNGDDHNRFDDDDEVGNYVDDDNNDDEVPSQPEFRNNNPVVTTRTTNLAYLSNNNDDNDDDGASDW